jgi:protocadherin Fat 4
LCFQVTDTNDNPPVFALGAYSFDVAENMGRGARVGTVMARDMDQGVNGQVSYSVISDWANDVFSLNPQSGVFTLTARLDYEEVRADMRTHSLLTPSGRTAKKTPHFTVTKINRLTAV